MYTRLTKLQLVQLPAERIFNQPLFQHVEAHSQLDRPGSRSGQAASGKALF